VGRAAEREVLKRATDACYDDLLTRVVTLVGAPRVGKTRILREVADELASADIRLPRICFASARGTDHSHGMFAAMLRARCSIAEVSDPEAAKAELRSQVAQVLDDRKVSDVCFFLGQLIDLGFPESPLTRALKDDPRQARALRRAIVRSFIEADTSLGNVCLIFDDLHCADEDSLELLKYLIENLSGPILILCAARPEFLAQHEDWFDYGRGRHDRLDVSALSAEESAILARQLLRPCEGGPPEPLVETAVTTASGNPGLLEQMIRIFHDSGVLQAVPSSAPDPAWKVDLERLTNAPLPMSVDDAVLARVASLSATERRLLEYGATMGSVFWLGGLTALGRSERECPEIWEEGHEERAALMAALSDLIERDYLLELPDSALTGEREYVFKHNLEREKIAALTSMTAARRYHQTLADWLGQLESVRSQEEYSAMLATHLEKAGAAARAGVAFLDAGDLARQSYASRKAHEYYARGLELLGDQDARRRIEALHNHGDVLLIIGKPEEALAAFRGMLALAYRLSLKSKGGAAHNRIGRLHRDLGQLTAARPHLDAALELFTQAGDERGVAASHDDIGKLLWLKGEYAAALVELKLGLEMRNKIGDLRSIALSLNNLGLLWMDHGKAPNARETLEASLQIRRDIGDPLGIVQSLNALGRLAQEQNDHARALELFREAHERSKEIGENNRIAIVLTNIGQSHYKLGNVAEGIGFLKQAEELCDGLGDKLQLGEAKKSLANAYLAQGELRQAREAIKHAVDLFGTVRSKAHLAGALRTLGDVTAAGAWGDGHETRAIDYFKRSITLFGEIGNELEVAKSCQAFSSYVGRSAHFSGDAAIQLEAKHCEETAARILSGAKS
jgi:tetratricopeptide (TPR) repeat protein